MSNSEFALRDHKVLQDVTKQQLLLREFFNDQILEKMITYIPTEGIPTEVFRQGYSDRGVFRQRYSDRGYSNKVFRQRYCDRGYSNRWYSDTGYSDRVYLLQVFSQVVPSPHTSPLLLKGGINFGLSKTTRMRANAPWARKRYHKRKAIHGVQTLLF